MPPCKRLPPKTEYRRSASLDQAGRSVAVLQPEDFSVHPADAALNWFVQVRWHAYAPCYVYYDSPLYNEYGERVGQHEGNTIYLNPEADHVGEDLLHEIGHAVARQFDLVGIWENYYYKTWEREQQRLIGAVTHGRHWSRYLNEFAQATENFQVNAGSELWAELFMMYHLYPDLPESALIEPAITELQKDPTFARLQAAIAATKSSWQLPARLPYPNGYTTD